MIIIIITIIIVIVIIMRGRVWGFILGLWVEDGFAVRVSLQGGRVMGKDSRHKNDRFQLKPQTLNPKSFSPKP